ncbi:MAG: hypothetical protein U1C51_05360 [Candidatus Izemoplasmatales bacterium]|nr:hypothetical protein [bacterium]MDZ4196663.1 hypothetical protein [Candidatus Izemoplasmatales bacterium]
MRDKVRLAQQIVYASKVTKVAKASQFGIMASAVLTFLIFAISFYGQQVGNSTIALERLAGRAGIVLYDNSEVKNYINILRSEPVKRADAMTGYCGTPYTIFQPGENVCIQSDEILSSVDGSNNRESYMVYTFYVENNGERAVDLRATLSVLDESKGAIESVRIRVIYENSAVTYAKPQTMYGPNPGEPEPLTVPFLSKNTVFINDYIRFEKTQVMKITIVIWYEGEDPDLTNAIMGGDVKLDFRFNASNPYDD